MKAAPTTVVYYDGSCPLCRAEIDLYRRRGCGDALRMVDVAAPGAALPPGLDRAAALARFHALSGDGRLLSGARAFAEMWQQVPGWRTLGRVAAQPGFRWALELVYRIFLGIRPLFVAAFLAARRRTAAIDRQGGGKAPGRSGSDG